MDLILNPWCKCGLDSQYGHHKATWAPRQLQVIFPSIEYFIFDMIFLEHFTNASPQPLIEQGLEDDRRYFFKRAQHTRLSIFPSLFSHLHRIYISTPMPPVRYPKMQWQWGGFAPPGHMGWAMWDALFPRVETLGWEPSPLTGRGKGRGKPKGNEREKEMRRRAGGCSECPPKEFQQHIAMDLTTRLTASMKSGTQRSSIDMSIASVAWRYPNVVPPLLSPASRAMPKSTWPCPPSPAGSPHPMNISLFILHQPPLLPPLPLLFAILHPPSSLSPLLHLHYPPPSILHPPSSLSPLLHLLSSILHLRYPPSSIFSPPSPPPQKTNGVWTDVHTPLKTHVPAAESHRLAVPASARP